MRYLRRLVKLRVRYGRRWPIGRSAPLAGVRLSITRTNLAVTTDADGKFAFEADVPPGKLDLFIDGRNVTNSNNQQYPSLHFEFNAIRGQRNILPHPIYLPPLLMSESKVVGGNQDVSLKIPGFEGFEMIVKANSVTFPDGAKVGPLVVSPVHLDKLPMVPPSGTATFMAPAWTIQPSGTRFDPPIEVRIPNSINLKVGETREIYQWDHDLATFVPMGRATVNEDASLLVSDAGSGITKAGWGGPPSVPPPDPDCAKTKGPSADDCGEKCQTVKSVATPCGLLTYCTPASPALTSERYSCCDGEKYKKESQCCLKIPSASSLAGNLIMERGKPFVEQPKGLYLQELGILPNDFSPKPSQYKGLAKSALDDGLPFKQYDEVVGDVTVAFAVDGCSVPPSLLSSFPKRLFINKGDLPSLANPHPDAEDFYDACRLHDYCYQTCGSKQPVCDLALSKQLETHCNGIDPELPGSGFRTYRSELYNITLVEPRREECKKSAISIYQGLYGFGFVAFQKRQSEMCVACK